MQNTNAAENSAQQEEGYGTKKTEQSEDKKKDPERKIHINSQRKFRNQT